MTKRLDWTEAAARDLRRVDFQNRERIRRAVDRLAESNHGDIKRLRDCEGQWRLRVGDWRIIFVYEHDASAIRIIRVLHRGRAYR